MPSVHARRSGLGALGAIIDRCLKKHRSERIRSARDLLAELESLVPVGDPPARAIPGRRHRIVALAVAATAGVVAVSVTDLPARLGAGQSVRPTGTAITDAPLPPSLRPEAQAAYDAALHGFRDANWGVAEHQLRQALALDPLLAAAHLRLALLLNYTAGRIPEARQSYGLAMQMRAALTARDRDILAAFEPLFTRDRPDIGRFTAQLAELGSRRPDDAEVLALLADFGTTGPEDQLRAARRAVEVDPAYADAWQAAGKQLFALGRTDEALHAFDACLAVSPAAVDCLGERAQLHAATGDCAATEADLHDAVAANPQGRYWRDLQASSSIAQGKPVETALEMLAQKWAALPEARRELVELHDRARLDLLRGQFVAARAGAVALQARARYQPDADQHARYATMLIDLAVEAGQLDDAAQVAEDYLRRRDAWIGEGGFGDDLAMLTVLRDAGRLSAGDFDARRSAWWASHRDLEGRMRTEAWLTAWARPAASRDAAVAALAAAPPGDLAIPVHTLDAHAAIGTVLLRAGRAAEAVRFLERAARGCDGFLAPVAHVRAAAQLGRALEATGDQAGACAAYHRVLDRWGATTAPSVTAREALRRATALSCTPVTPSPTIPRTPDLIDLRPTR
jgi:serine/threonine-protein kinase